MTAELETAIERDPYDTRSYAVYGDWLQQRGDPRGELIALQIAAEETGDPALAEVAAAYLARHRDLLLPTGRESLTWRAGFIRGITISPHNPNKAELLEEILAHPSGRFVAELVIGYEDTGGLQDAIDVIAMAPRPALRELHLGSSYLDPDGSMIQDDIGDVTAIWQDVGDLAALWRAARRLANLTVTGNKPTFGDIDAPALVRMRVATFALSEPNARSIARARWPMLESLEVRYGMVATHGQAVLGEVERLLARTDLPKLVHLGIIGADFADELCAVLPAAPLVRQLRELDLSQGRIGDAGATRLAAHADAFAHLDVLDVSMNRLTPAGVAAIAGIAKTVVTRDQSDGDDRIADLYDY